MCNYCNYTSPKRYLLTRHMKTHSEERPHKCEVCERGFKTLASLQVRSTFYLFCPDVTIPKKQAGYTATPIALGWAGAVFEDISIWIRRDKKRRPHQRRIHIKDKQVPTDGSTDGWMEKAGCKVACTRLKRGGNR